MRTRRRTRYASLVQTEAPGALGFAAATLVISAAYWVAAQPWRYGNPDLARLLSGLALDADRVAAGGWHGLLAHGLLHPHLTHLALTLGLLLTAGAAVERSWGTVRFLAVWMAGTLVAAAGAWSLGWLPAAGGSGGALALLGVALVVGGGPSPLGRSGGRAVWLLVAVVSVAGLAVLEWAPGPWHVAPQAMALPVGAAIAFVPGAWVRWRHRRWLERGAADLAAEPAARERVDVLLARIATDGLASLTRRERRELAEASRFFAPGRRRSAPPAPSRPARADARAPRPPAE